MQLARTINAANTSLEKKRAAKADQIRREELQKQKALDNERKANFAALLRNEIRQTKGALDLELKLEEAKANKIKFKESEITNFKIAQQNQILQAKRKNDSLVKASEAAILNDLKKLHKNYINNQITETKGLFDYKQRIRQAEKQNIRFTESEIQSFKMKAEKAVAREKQRLSNKAKQDAKKAAQETARIEADQIKRSIQASKDGIKLQDAINARKVAGVKFTETQIYQLKKANDDKAAQARKQASDKVKADAKKAAEDKKAIFLKETQYLEYSNPRKDLDFKAFYSKPKNEKYSFQKKKYLRLELQIEESTINS